MIWGSIPVTVPRTLWNASLDRAAELEILEMNLGARPVAGPWLGLGTQSVLRSLTVCTQPEPQGLDPQGLFDRIDK